MLSSSETELLKDLLGEMFILLEAQTILLRKAWTPALDWLLLIEHVPLESTNPLDFALNEAGKVSLDITFFLELATESLFVLAVLDTHGTFK